MFEVSDTTAISRVVIDARAVWSETLELLIHDPKVDVP